MLVSLTALGRPRLKFFVQMIATGFGAGYSPVAPGSIGTLVGIPVYLLISVLAWPVQFLAVIVLSVFAVYVAGSAEAALGQKDPARIVIDEIAGLQVALFLIPPSGWHLLAGYVLFRFFDIVKVFPARLCESKLPGGYGIVMDDIISGIYANIVLSLAIYLLKF